FHERILLVDWPANVLITFVSRLADLEERLATGASEAVQVRSSTSCLLRSDLPPLSFTASLCPCCLEPFLLSWSTSRYSLVSRSSPISRSSSQFRLLFSLSSALAMRLR
ncbi:hypothetical protein TGFOU_361360, partial [Toxoplasma gondii FOU]